jgi:hypothetical protein
VLAAPLLLVSVLNAGKHCVVITVSRFGRRGAVKGALWRTLSWSSGPMKKRIVLGGNDTQNCQ